MSKHFVKKSFTLLSLLVALINNALGDEVRIGNVDELVQFKDGVNSGTNYEGTTVLLDSDLDFTGKEFEPIGTDSNDFRGTFNGQGHVISNLAMNSTSQNVGLFGYSKGLAIRNVILDSSCSITSPRSDSGNSFVGIIGNCNTYDGPCIIENSVNMASLSFTGNIGGYTLYLGGIAGCLFIYSYNITVKNCANYGDLKHSGTNSNSQIGGIVGNSYGASDAATYIYNSISYGTITYSGTTNSLHLGGIIGLTQYTTIKDCVSSGKIESTGTVNTNNYIGSIVGNIWSDTYISYCYITSELSSYKKYGETYSTPSESNVLSYDSTTFELSGAASVGSYTGTSLIDALNAAVDVNTGYSHWLLNKNSNAVSFTINGRAAPISLNYQIMVLPSLMSEGNMSFAGWYTDNALITPLASYEVTSDTALYGRYGVILTVSFESNGGESVSFASKKVALNDVYGELPETPRTGHTFDGWFTAQTGGDKVEPGSIVTISSDHTLYAHWTINQYTITFDFDNGTVSNVVLDFDTAIEYPEDMAREGFAFIEWKPKPETMPAENVTVKAQWEITNPTECVDIMFSQEGMTEDEARKIIEGFAPEGAKFRVAITESSSEGTRAGAKFNNKEKAKEFVEAVISSSDTEKSGIKTVGFFPSGCSFATSLGLSILAYFLAYLLAF